MNTISPTDEIPHELTMALQRLATSSHLLDKAAAWLRLNQTIIDLRMRGVTMHPEWLDLIEDAESLLIDNEQRQLSSQAGNAAESTEVVSPKEPGELLNSAQQRKLARRERVRLWDKSTDPLKLTVQAFAKAENVSERTIHYDLKAIRESRRK